MSVHYPDFYVDKLPGFKIPILLYAVAAAVILLIPMGLKRAIVVVFWYGIEKSPGS